MRKISNKSHMRDKGDKLIMAIKPGWNRGLRYNIRDGRAVNIHRAKEKEKGDAYEDYLNRSYNSHRKEIANAKLETAKARADASKRLATARAASVEREALHKEIVAALRDALRNRDEEIAELKSTPKVIRVLKSTPKVGRESRVSRVCRAALDIVLVAVPVIIGMCVVYGVIFK